MSLTEINMDHNVIKADIGPLFDLLIRLEVSLKVVFRCRELHFVGVLEQEWIFIGNEEVKRGRLESGVVELALDVRIDEGWNAGEVHEYD